MPPIFYIQVALQIQGFSLSFIALGESGTWSHLMCPGAQEHIWILLTMGGIPLYLWYIYINLPAQLCQPAEDWTLDHWQRPFCWRLRGIWTSYANIYIWVIFHNIPCEFLSTAKSYIKMTLTVFNGGIIGVYKLSFHELYCKRWLPCARQSANMEGISNFPILIPTV